MNYRFSHIEQLSDGLWYIMWPDCTKAWRQGYKTRNWATRVLNEICK
jgi:hypothetical protein